MNDIPSDFEIDEAELVGDGGHFIVLHARGNDGREKWRIHNQTGEVVCMSWGKDEALQACRQLIKEGRISK